MGCASASISTSGWTGFRGSGSKSRCVDQRILQERCPLSPTADIPSHMSGAAMCQRTKSLRDSGEVRLVLSIIPRGAIIGSGGSALS